MKRELVIVSLILLGLLSGLFAQDPTPNLSYERARELLLENNSEYKAAEAELNAARWGKNGAFSSFLPNLSLNGNLLYMDPAQEVSVPGGTMKLNNDFRTFSLQLQQPIFMGGKVWQAYKMSGVGVEMAELALQNKELSLLAELETSYLSVLQTLDLLKVSRMDFQASEQQLEIAAVKRDMGVISPAEYLRFESAKASKEVSLLQTENAFSLAQMSLMRLLGLDYSPIPEPIDTEAEDSLLALLISYDARDTEKLRFRALVEGKSFNPILRIAHNSVDLSRRAYQISKGSFLPTVILTGSRQYSENGIERWDFSAANQIMLNVSVPILPQLGNYSAMRKAEYELIKSRYEEQNTHDGITMGIEAAVLNLVSGAKQVRAAKLALDYSSQTYEQMLERYRLDMISSTDLLNMDLMLSAARISYTNSLFSYYKARAALKQLLGYTQMQELTAILFSTTGAERD